MTYDSKSSIWLKRTGVIFIILVTGIIVSFFLFRNQLLHKIFDRNSKKLKAREHVDITVFELHFSGFSRIVLKNLVAVPDQQDTLLIIDSAYVSPSLLWMLIGKIKLKEAIINNASLNLICTNDDCNYEFIFRKRQEASTRHVERNYGAMADRLLTKIFNLSPQKANFRNIQIQFRSNKRTEQLIIPEFSSSEEEMHGSFLNLPDSTYWTLAGKFSQSSRTFDVKIYPDNKKSLSLPFTQSLFSAECSFDTLHGALSEYAYNGDKLNLKGNITANELFIKHRRISDDPVIIHQVDFNFNALIGKNYFELDSSSTYYLNKILIHPYLFCSNDQNKKYNLKIGFDQMNATDFFASLPEGMFDEVNGIVADGKLEYHLGFFLGSSEPDSLLFSSSLKKESFHLKRYGNVNLSKMNDEFLYDAYDGDRLVRSFSVGASNPDFTPLDQISPYLKNAIMTSEDGSFFFHNGFNEDAFRKSIAANYKAGKFVRGGSTISMQLVKNVFLNRHKTIARKAEEALIVWLIESNRLCSKERMFEVYLNIIELGPGIYGVGEASRFYFNKKPSELDLAESVFIASLLPRPKWFKYSFDEQGNLKPYFADYYRVVANFLLRKNLINQGEYDQLQPHVYLKGPALQFITPKDSMPSEEEQGNDQ